MWDEEVQLEVQECNREIINLTCRFRGNGKTIRISLIHASTNFQEKLLLWQKLRAIHHANRLPWLCVGDFNEILYRLEKLGKRQADYHRMVAFQEMLNDCALMDLESKGCAYTWANNREGNELVRERLDRVVCNME